MGRLIVVINPDLAVWVSNRGQIIACVIAVSVLVASRTCHGDDTPGAVIGKSELPTKSIRHLEQQTHCRRDGNWCSTIAISERLHQTSSILDEDELTCDVIGFNTIVGGDGVLPTRVIAADIGQAHQLV